MFKEAKGLSLILVLTTGLWGCFLLPCFSQGTEKVTITTYYPSPFGSYDKLRTNKLVIGDPDASSTPSPDTDGVVRFKGRGSDPAGADDTKPGALYYNTADNEFKYHDGSGWQALGGGGGITGGCVLHIDAAFPLVIRSRWGDGCKSVGSSVVAGSAWTGYCDAAPDAGYECGVVSINKVLNWSFCTCVKQ